MKKKLVLLIFLMLAAVAAGAQEDVKALVEADLWRAMAVQHTYEQYGTVQTPAPKGYKPFYISHYGRHGSRCKPERYVVRCDSWLQDLGRHGMLTELGADLRTVMTELGRFQAGRYGMLTEKGGREHEGISERMYHNFPSVFSGKGPRIVTARSSTSLRCMQSMAYFCGQLRSEAPSLQFTYSTGPAVMDVIVPPLGIPDEKTARRKAIVDSLTHALLNPERFCTALFRDPEAALAHIGVDAYAFMYQAYEDFGTASCLDIETPDLGKFFTFDELFALWRALNTRFFINWGLDTTVGVGRPASVSVLLRDFIEKADAAIAGNGVAADLRFGHDGVLFPLMALMGLEESCWEGPAVEAYAHWLDFKSMCMCSNLQMVFYRGRGEDVLVKFLHNERETSIVGVEAVSWPYYRWEDVKVRFGIRIGESGLAKVPARKR